MLISISVRNFKSIRDLQTLSLEARKDAHLEWSNVIGEGKRRLVKAAAIYGANASGKSNLIKALVWFRDFVVGSSKEKQIGEQIDIDPFRLSSETEKAPSHFEIEFHREGFDYRYGFELTSDKVEAEWLFRKSPNAKPAKLFTREHQNFEVSSSNFREGKGLEKRTRPNALFLSVCAQLNGEESGKILEWMLRLLYVPSLTGTNFDTLPAAEQLQDPTQQEKLLDLTRTADFNIQSLHSEMEDIAKATRPGETDSLWTRSVIGGKIATGKIKTTHRKFDAKGTPCGDVEFDLQEDESDGTQKFLALCGPVLHALEEGNILLVDELEARLHPRLTQAILDLFHSPANRKNAQLICATHDVTLLEPERFRRDQIWFCEKDEAGATDLFSLADIDSNLVRPTSKFSRQYMLGLFGAVPQITHFEDAAIHAAN